MNKKLIHSLSYIVILFSVWLIPSNSYAGWTVDWPGTCYTNPTFTGPTVYNLALQAQAYHLACNTCEHVTSIVSVDEQSGQFTLFITKGIYPGCYDDNFVTLGASSVGVTEAPGKNQASCNNILNPCNPSTGSKYQRETDYQGAFGVPNFTRHYNSFKAIYSHLYKDKNLGFGWTAIALKRLEILNVAEPRLITVYRLDGKFESFREITTGVWQGDSEFTVYP